MDSGTGGKERGPVIRSGKRLVLALAGAGILVILAATVAGRQGIQERWWLRKMESPDPAERKKALDALVGLRSVRAVPFLLDALAAGTMDLPQLDSEGGDTREENLHPEFAALLAIGRPAIPGLLRALERGEKPAAQAWAARILPAIDIDSLEVVRALEAHAEDPFEPLGLIVRKELRKIYLLWKLREPDPDIRAAAAANLHGAGRLRRVAIPRLVEALRDDLPEVRARIARVLATMGAEAAPALEALKTLAGRDPDPSVREEASQAIGTISGE